VAADARRLASVTMGAGWWPVVTMSAGGSAAAMKGAGRLTARSGDRTARPHPSWEGRRCGSQDGEATAARPEGRGGGGEGRSRGEGSGGAEGWQGLVGRRERRDGEGGGTAAGWREIGNGGIKIRIWSGSIYTRYTDL
jgi:hypothetical protein